MRQETVICDSCGKQGKPKWDNAAPLNWLRLTKLRMRFRKSDKKENIDDKNIIDIDDDKDPDFCSKECFITWISKEIDKIMK